jgi:hypothetical protein
MILLKPTFDVHVSEMNSLKVTALAVTEKAKRHLQSFFKSNDSYHQLSYERLEDFFDFCYSRRLELFIDDNVRCGDQCPQCEERHYDSLLCDPHGEPDAAA